MSKKSDKPKAVVAGLDFSGLGLTRALSRSGADVVSIIDSADNRGMWTRYGRKVRCLKTGPVALTECLVAVAEGFKGARAALFLTSDQQVMEVSDNSDLLSRYYSFNLPGRDVVKRLMDKRLFAGYAAARHLPVPETFFVKDSGDAARVAEQIKYPCILKPVYKTHKWVSRGLPKTFKAGGPEELKRAYGLAAQASGEFIVQEWIEGGDEEIYFCLAYWPSGPAEPVFFTGRKVRQWPPECGNTSMAEPCEDAAVKETTFRLFKDIGFRGFGSVEYKRERGSGRLLIIEPTVGRVNLQSALAYSAGVDMPYFALCDMLGLELPRLDAPSRQIHWICEPHELLNFRHRIRSGELSLPAWLRSLKGRRHYALFEWNDPLPLVRYLLSVFKSRITNGKD